MAPASFRSSRPAPPAPLAGGRMVTGLALVVVSVGALGCAGRTAGTGDSPAAPPSPSPAASSSPAPPSSLEDAWKVRSGGAGPVKVGMTLREVEEATHSKVRPNGPPAEGSDCTYVEIEGAPKGLAFMVTGNRIARVDVLEGSTVRTAEGAGAGSTEDAVKALYPRLQVEPAKYLEGGHDLIHTASATSKIIFETDGAKVLAFHAGKEPEVSYVEGCS